MALCRRDKADVKFDVTPVENLFIQEYMVDAPGDYVKVYLCALMQSRFPAAAEPSLEKFAAALHMDVQGVLDALRYWQRRGLVRPLDGEAPAYALLNVRSAMFDGAESARESGFYRYSEFNNRVADLLPGKKLTPRDYEAMSDWIELFGISEEAALVLIKFCVDKWGVAKVTVSKMTGVAREWQKKGVDTPEKARDYVSNMMLAISPASDLLPYIGINYRRATAEEDKLFRKWRDEWGFSMDGIRAACAPMKNIQNPNFGYLDKILEGLHKRGLHTVHQVETGLMDKDARKAPVQECARKLGVIGVVTEEYIRYYEGWRAYGMEHEAILSCCAEAAAQGNGSFKGAESLISAYARRGVKTAEALERDHKLDRELSRVYAAAGIRKQPTAADKKALERWLQVFPLEVVLQGAEYSSDTLRPMAFLSKLLDEWQKAGVKNVAGAKAERERHLSAQAQGGQRGAAGVSSIHTDSATLRSDDLQDLFEDFGKEDK